MYHKYMPTSANKEHDSNDIYGDMTLEQWAQRCHKKLASESGWYYQPLKRGQFGWDNMIVSVGHCLSNLDWDCPDVEQAAKLIHDGWCLNYKYWRDNKPYLCNSEFKKPKKGLGDSRRNMCADTPYHDLPNDEKDKDLVIAKIIINLVTDVY